MIKARKNINDEILAYMSNEGYALKPGSKSPHTLDSWVFGYINAGGNPDNIKILIIVTVATYFQWKNVQSVSTFLEI